MVVSVSDGGSTVTLGAPAALFTIPSINFSLSSDGQRILIPQVTTEKPLVSRQNAKNAMPSFSGDVTCGRDLAPC
jgi:hypothetical protein